MSGQYSFDNLILVGSALISTRKSILDNRYNYTESEANIILASVEALARVADVKTLHSKLMGLEAWSSPTTRVCARILGLEGIGAVIGGVWDKIKEMFSKLFQKIRGFLGFSKNNTEVKVKAIEEKCADVHTRITARGNSKAEYAEIIHGLLNRLDSISNLEESIKECESTIQKFKDDKNAEKIKAIIHKVIAKLKTNSRMGYLFNHKNINSPDRVCEDIDKFMVTSTILTAIDIFEIENTLRDIGDCKDEAKLNDLLNAIKAAYKVDDLLAAGFNSQPDAENQTKNRTVYAMRPAPIGVGSLVIIHFTDSEDGGFNFVPDKHEPYQVADGEKIPLAPSSPGAKRTVGNISRTLGVIKDCDRFYTSLARAEKRTNATINKLLEEFDNQEAGSNSSIELKNIRATYTALNSFLSNFSHYYSTLINHYLKIANIALDWLTPIDID